MSNDDNPTSLEAVAHRALRVTGATGRRELARKAEEAGVKIGRQTWNALLNGEYDRGVHKAGASLLESLAKVANLHPDKVRRAASMPKPATPFANDLPEDADYITGASRQILIDAIRLFAQQSRRTAELEAELKELRNDVDRSAPTTVASSVETSSTDEADLARLSDADLRELRRVAGEQQYLTNLAARVDLELQMRQAADPQRTAGEESQDPDDASG